MSNEQSKGFEESPRDVIGRKRTVLGDVARMKPLPEAEGEMNCVVGMVNQLAVKREIDKAIEQRISQAINRTTYSSMLGWDSPFFLEIEKMVKARVKEKLAPIIEGGKNDG